MKEEAIQYINNQLKVAQDRLRPYVQNDGQKYRYRPVFYRIQKHINHFIEGNKEVRWIIIPGLRGVGKTTVAAQTFFYFKNKVNENHILYISADDIVTAGLTLREVLMAYEQVLGTNFESLKTSVVLIIDEVQQDPQWAAVLKSMYDRARNVFVISTGSSAVHLQSNPDVARRGVFEKLYPLSFWEYQMLMHNTLPVKELKQDLKTALYGSSSAEEVYRRLQALEQRVKAGWKNAQKDDVNLFLSTGTLPFTLRLANNDVYERISLLIDRMINKDIQELGRFDAQTLGIIKRLLFIMADGLDGLSVSKISGVLGVQRPTLMAVLDALEKAEIIIKVAPYGSGMTAAKKPSKYLFMSPAIRMSLLSITGLDQTFLMRRGKLLEDVAGLHFYREFIATGVGNISYDTAEAGADFILQISNKKQIAIEIGLGEKDLHQVRNTMQKAQCHYGLVICSSNSVTLSKEDNIVKVPLEYFLLM
jgi:hypothetical protein